MRENLPSTSWLVFSNFRSQEKLRLFCFPYAGGGASIFRNWAAHLPAEVELCAIQLPGRGHRLMEPCFSQLTPLVHTLADILLPHLEQPFAFFGHSMGALISFELTRHLNKQFHICPSQLFVSGHGAPQLPRLSPPIHNLPDEKFCEELRRLNGTPEEILEQPEIVQLLLPCLRADFAMCETYCYLADSPLTCPVTAFGGLQDQEVSREQIEGWNTQTNAPFLLKMLPGNHFFLHTSEPLFLQMLSQELHRLI